VGIELAYDGHGVLDLGVWKGIMVNQSVGVKDIVQICDGVCVR
jgi:hypothetical protein